MLIRGQLFNHLDQQRWMDGEDKFRKQLEMINENYGLIVTAKINAEFRVIIPDIFISHEGYRTSMGDYILWFRWV